MARSRRRRVSDESSSGAKKPSRDGVVDLSKKTAQIKPASSSAKNSARRVSKKQSANKKKKLSKGAIFGLTVLGVLVVAGGAYGAFSLFSSPDEEIEEPPVPVFEEESNDLSENQRRTDGVILVDETQTNNFPAAVMIENLSTVRPQSGLGVANIVYETLAEGGITRFMAILAGDEAPEIRPVRSARPYYLEWASEYDALYVHAGGSPQALAAIDGLQMNDLDALTNDGKYFYRGAGVAPHNLYTSSELLKFAMRDKGLEDGDSDFEPWKFDAEEALADVEGDSGEEIEVDFSTGAYNVSFEYDEENECYLRYHAGIAHEDLSTDEQLCPKNVVVQIVPEATSAGEKGRINLDVTGEGRVVVFRDGKAFGGVWKKEDREDRTKFYDENDDEIALNPGQIWISVVPEDKRFEYR